MRVVESGHLRGAFAFLATREDSIRKNQITRLELARKRADNSRSDHQFRAPHRIECAPRRFGCAFRPDSMSNDRELFAPDVPAKATKALARECGRVVDPAPENSDFARKGIKDEYQSRDLSIELFDLERLSEPAYVSKIARVFFIGGIIN
jgi:hypothetical protein